MPLSTESFILGKCRIFSFPNTWISHIILCILSAIVLIKVNPKDTAAATNRDGQKGQITNETELIVVGP